MTDITVTANGAQAEAPTDVVVSIPTEDSTKSPKKPRSSRRSPTSRSSKGSSRKTASAEKQGRKRANRNYPAGTFEDALELGLAILKHASGQKVRRLTLFDLMKKAPDSGPSRQLVINSARYGITTGGYQAEHLELTPEGRQALSEESKPREKARARFKLAIEDIPPFRELYERVKGNKLPSQAVLRDYLVDAGYDKDEAAGCVDLFIINAKYVGILKPLAGAERLISIDHLLDETPGVPLRPPTNEPAVTDGTVADASSLHEWDSICFYITPIGESESEERRHSDLFLGSLIEPAVEQLGLKVVRADHIGKPGMITAQVLEHVLKSRLVIADLSYHNPNVFYELSLRHATGLPTVQVIRVSDRIPFDLDQFRTIQIDTTSIYTLVPQLQTYVSQIADQVRRVLETSEAIDNPLTAFAPGLRVTLPVK